MSRAAKCASLENYMYTQTIFVWFQKDEIMRVVVN